MEVKLKFNDINVKEEKEKTLVKVLMLKGEKGDTVSAEWGTVTGNISEQEDLKNALDSKANSSDVPTKTSDLQNDSGFINNNVNNLVNYYNKTETDNKLKKKVYFFDTIALMKSSIDLVEGDMVITKGYYSADDGGAGEYIVVDDNTLVDDGGSAHEVTNGLFAKLISNEVNVKQFGAKGDGTTDDTNAIKKAIDKFHNISIENGTYYITSVNISNLTCSIKGKNATITYGVLSFNNNCNVSINDINFENINRKAIYTENSNLTIKNCNFNNITIDTTANLTSHGAIYCEQSMYFIAENCKFENVKSYGAVYTHGWGYIDVNLCYFNNCDYRAFNILKHSSAIVALKGNLRNNIIQNCGANNTAETGAVGCNGIYAHGCSLLIENNFIKDSRENAIEIGSEYLNRIINNLIDGTNVEVPTKDTPSVEGIFINCDADIINNHLKNVKRRGITNPIYTTNNTRKVNISNNIIEAIEEYDNEANSIYVLSATNGNENKTIANNDIKNNVVCTDAKSNCTYVGDVKALKGASTSFNTLISPNIKNLFSCYFDTLDSYNGFTVSNLGSPEIITIPDTNIKALKYTYAQYNKILSPTFLLKKGMIKIKITYMGSIQCRIYKNGNYNKTLIETETSETLKTIESVYKLIDESDLNEFYVNINNPNTGTDLIISKVDLEVIEGD